MYILLCYVNSKLITIFFFSVEDKIETTLDAVLSDAYCRSHMFLSKQMAKLRPELTMPMFSGKQSNSNKFGVYDFSLMLTYF